MTTATLVTADRTVRVAGLGSTPFAGTGALLRFGLRRERIALPAWVLGVAAALASTLGSFSSLYPDAGSRADFAANLAANPAFTVLTGPVFGSSLGGLVGWRMTLLGAILTSLMAIFTVIRRTRADEEAGRTELLAATAIGRAAPLAAALGCALVGCLGMVMLTVAILVGGGEPASGALALGGAIAGPGLLFAGVAAVTAQLFDSARPAIGLAGATLGVSFVIRAAADAGGDGLSWLRWLSPLGWAEEIKAFAADRFWVLGILVGGAAALATVAAWLLAHRDVGLGLAAAKPGPGRGALHTPGALAARLQRPSTIGWVAGLAAFGAVIGTIVDSAGSLFDDNPQFTEVLARIGGPGAISDAVLSGMAGTAGILAAVAAVTAAGRMVTEENSERAASVLASATARARWLAGHLVFVLGIPVAMMAAAGVTSGIGHGIRSGNFGSGLGNAITAHLAQIPAAWVIGAIAVAIFGLAPRIWTASWIVLVVCVLIAMLGPALELPQWLIDASPVAHSATVATVGIPWLAMLVLTVIAAVLLVIGVRGFIRRDLVTR